MKRLLSAQFFEMSAVLTNFYRRSTNKENVEFLSFLELVAKLFIRLIRFVKISSLLIARFFKFTLSEKKKKSLRKILNTYRVNFQKYILTSAGKLSNINICYGFAFQHISEIAHMYVYNNWLPISKSCRFSCRCGLEFQHLFTPHIQQSLSQPRYNLKAHFCYLLVYYFSRLCAVPAKSATQLLVVCQHLGMCVCMFVLCCCHIEKLMSQWRNKSGLQHSLDP